MSQPNNEISLPTIYIQALNDKLVSSNKGTEITQICMNSEILKIAGPHFILQAKPIESARLITKAIRLIIQRQ